jgi:hypothetical protein
LSILPNTPPGPLAYATHVIVDISMSPNEMANVIPRSISSRRIVVRGVFCIEKMRKNILGL